MLNPEAFFGQNLKFSKLGETWHRGTLPYAYYDFHVYFSQIFFIHVFVQIWYHNQDFVELTEILWRGTLPYAYYSFNVHFFKILFIWKIWSQKIL